tara:strand:+ start:120 stop:1463 length:1344 start_codon:yes stop_codon:yes gene_type:complete
MSQGFTTHQEIVPSNVSSDGSLSYKNGQPTIQFLLGEQDRYIKPGSIRLVGEFTVFKTGTTIPVKADKIRMNERLGVNSIIDQLNIFSQKTGQSMESITHWGRMMSSYLSVTQSPQDFVGHSYESSLRYPNFAGQQKGVVQNTQGAAGAAGRTRNEFCIPLVSGLFNGEEAIPLSGTWGVGGLRIEIQLAPDSNVLFSEDSTTTGIADAFYQLTNVRLICEVETPPADQLSRLMSQTSNTFVYNSISSYYQTINSANATLNFNLALSKVLGVFMNVVPAKHINSLIRDGLATYPFTNADGSMAKVEQVVWTRGGERYPLQYNVDTLQRSDPANQVVDAQLSRNYLNSVMAFAKLGRTSVDPTNFRYFENGDAEATFTQAKEITKGGSAFGLGVAYDSISDQGIDFSTQPFGVQLQLALTSDSPNAIFLFVHSKQTVLSTPAGIQVIK